MFLFYHYYYILVNTSIDLESIPSSLSSVIVEPCVFCDGGSFDYIESVDENGISLADGCSTSISDIDNSLLWAMLTTNDSNFSDREVWYLS